MAGLNIQIMVLGVFLGAGGGSGYQKQTFKIIINGDNIIPVTKKI